MKHKFGERKGQLEKYGFVIERGFGDEPTAEVKEVLGKVEKMGF